GFYMFEISIYYTYVSISLFICLIIYLINNNNKECKRRKDKDLTYVYYKSIYIGMSEESLVNSLGKPNKIVTFISFDGNIQANYYYNNTSIELINKYIVSFETVDKNICALSI
ncbi:MAG: hypothetical protein RSF67_00260, partial [Clostridia bacterium]